MHEHDDRPVGGAGLAVGDRPGRQVDGLHLTNLDARAAGCRVASRRDSPDSRSPSRSTSARTHTGFVLEYSRSAHPIALRSQKDRSSRLASIDVVQQVGVGVGPVPHLAQHGGTPDPEVVVACPGPHHGSDLRPVAGQHPADQVGGDLVDVVPPRARHHEVAVEVERGGVLPRACRAVAGERGGGVPLLAMAWRRPTARGPSRPTSRGRPGAYVARIGRSACLRRGAVMPW